MSKLTCKTSIKSGNSKLLLDQQPCLRVFWANHSSLTACNVESWQYYGYLAVPQTFSITTVSSVLDCVPYLDYTDRSSNNSCWTRCFHLAVPLHTPDEKQLQPNERRCEIVRQMLSSKTEVIIVAVS
jgi:hypothetical protein